MEPGPASGLRWSVMKDTAKTRFLARPGSAVRYAACVVLVLLLPAAAGAQPAVEARLDELALGTRVRLALLNDEVLEPFPFDVSVSGRDVTVQGAVRTQEQWARVSTIVQRLQGVGAVVNEVELTDGEIPDPEVVLDAEALDVDVDALDPMLRIELEDEADPSTGVPEEPVVEAPAAGTSEAEEPAAGGIVPAGFHRVEAGDTLLKLSETYGTPIRDIRRMNNLSRAEALEPGRLLRVLPENEAIEK